MGAFNRLSDIVNANVNAALTRAEDPEKMIRLAITEMQDQLAYIRTQTVRYKAESDQLVRRIDARRQEHVDWEARAERAVNNGRDDLARAALIEKSAVAAALENSETELQTIDTALTEFRSAGVQLEEKLKNAKSRQQALILRAQTATSRARVRKQLHQFDSQEAMSRFELYERRLDELEGQAEADDIGRHGVAVEIEALTNNQAIDDELEQLKTRIKGTGSITPTREMENE